MTERAPLTVDEIKAFVLAAHWDFAKVQAMLADRPDLLHERFDWGQSGLEDAIGAAAHVGNRPIAEFLLSKGAVKNICVAAMLGNLDEVKVFLAQDSKLANARGAHGIPLMFHAAMSGSLPIVEMLNQQGCSEGYDSAVHGAIRFQHGEIVAWLLDHGVKDVNSLDYEQRTPLDRAIEFEQPGIADLLRKYGAKASQPPA